MATLQTVSPDLVQKVSPGDVPEELVTLPMAYATAMHGLNTLARAEPGESVLILHGTGNFGAAAISISKTINAKTYVALSLRMKLSRLLPGSVSQLRMSFQSAMRLFQRRQRP